MVYFYFFFFCFSYFNLSLTRSMLLGSLNAWFYGCWSETWYSFSLLILLCTLIINLSFQHRHSTHCTAYIHEASWKQSREIKLCQEHVIRLKWERESERESEKKEKHKQEKERERESTRFELSAHFWWISKRWKSPGLKEM